MLLVVVIAFVINIVVSKCKAATTPSNSTVIIVYATPNIAASMQLSEQTDFTSE